MENDIINKDQRQMTDWEKTLAAHSTCREDSYLYDKALQQTHEERENSLKISNRWKRSFPEDEIPINKHTVRQGNTNQSNEITFSALHTRKKEKDAIFLGWQKLGGNIGLIHIWGSNKLHPSCKVTWCNLLKLKNTRPHQ